MTSTGNVSTENVRFVLLEGAVFTPVGGDAQSLISYQYPVEPPTLPLTGGSLGTQGVTMGLMVAAGLMMLAASTVLRRAAR